MTRLELEAQITRAETCLQNATDPQDQRHWFGVLQEIRERIGKTSPAIRDVAGEAAERGSQSVSDLGEQFTTDVGVRGMA